MIWDGTSIYIKIITHHIFFDYSKNGRDFRLWALECNLGTDAAHEEEVVPTSQPSTCRASSTSRSSFLDEIGPLQAAPPKKPSNRSRKPIQSIVFTSPGSVVKGENLTKRTNIF